MREKNDPPSAPTHRNTILLVSYGENVDHRELVYTVGKNVN